MATLNEFIKNCNQLVAQSPDASYVYVTGLDLSHLIKRRRVVLTSGIVPSLPTGNEPWLWFDTISNKVHKSSNWRITSNVATWELVTHYDDLYNEVEDDSSGGGGSGSTGNVVFYEHVQVAPSDLWIIPHGLNSMSALCVIELNGAVVLPNEMYPYDLNTYKVQFNMPVSGKANLVLKV
jgi:hypothetical protein